MGTIPSSAAKARTCSPAEAAQTQFIYTSLSEAGDTITDFDIAAGDKIGIEQLLEAIGYGGDNPIGDGIVSLQAGTGGSWLKIFYNGDSTLLAFLTGVSANASLAAILGITETPGRDPEPQPGTTPEDIDNTYVFDDSFVENWTTELGTVTDTNGGTDTLDLAAVTHKADLKLESGGHRHRWIKAPHDCRGN